jgi:hypothetical protein
MGVKLQGRETGDSPPSRAEVKNRGAIPPLPHKSSWRGVLLIKHRDSFAFNFLVVCFRVLMFTLPLASPHSAPCTCLYHSLLRAPRIVLIFLFVLSYFYIFILLHVKFFSSYPSSPPPFSSALVVCLSVWGSVRVPQFVKPTPSALFAVFSLSSGCVAVKAVSGRAHVPYHGRRSVSRYMGNLGSARSGPICNE